MAREFHYGGQAVMEGVMIRGKKAAVVAVRRPNGELALNIRPLPAIYTGRLRQVPFIRGVIVLLEALVLGISSLVYSANVSLEEEGEELSRGATWLVLLVSIAFAVGLFFLAPLFLTRVIDPYINSSLVFHLIEGGIRLVILLGYMMAISFLPDIRKVFAYHGAEHKTIHAYEDGVPLEAEAVQKYSTAHARCGTAFLLAVLVIAIIVFALIGRQVVWLMVLSRVLLLPVIAALGYEATQYGARHMNNVLVRALVAPGLWLQRLTTREPDDKQIEVAVAALQQALVVDGEGEEEAQPDSS
ncbi:MAG: DUF1385 domain-containing protein [Dehalococcoidales bacterium]|nr:DUF1385 domain-containing protein [Dehalococcoidales bacterium]